MEPTPEQLQAFVSVLSTEDNPDFKIKIDDYEWRIHAAVASRQSEFFEKLIYGEFLEATERTAILHDDHPWMVARMIQFMYFGRYDYEHDASSAECSLKKNNLPEFITLNKFMRRSRTDEDHEDLRRIDEERSFVEIAAMMYQIADKYSITALMNLAMEDLLQGEFKSDDDFCTVVDLLTPELLHRERELLQHMIESISDGLMENPSQYPQLATLLGTAQVISVALIHYLQNKCKELKEEKDMIRETTSILLAERDEKLKQTRDALAEKTAEVERLRMPRNSGGRRAATSRRRIDGSPVEASSSSDLIEF